MILKIVRLFLVFMAVLAMFGRLRVPPSLKNRFKRGQDLPKPRLCNSCGRYVVSGGQCECEGGHG